MSIAQSSIDTVYPEYCGSTMARRSGSGVADRVQVPSTYAISRQGTAGLNVER